jgi:hypothetical protein
MRTTLAQAGLYGLMFAAFQKSWKDLTHGKPGHRFQRRYENKKRSGGENPWRRVMNFALALACLAVGVVLVFIPGPAILFFLIGGGLLAAESRVVASGLDYSEFKVRAMWTWIKRRWRKLHVAGKAAVGTLIAGGAMGCAFVSYKLLMAD